MNKEINRLGNIDIDEWLLNKGISTLAEVEVGKRGDRLYLSDILEIFLKEQLQAIKQKERSKQ